MGQCVIRDPSISVDPFDPWTTDPLSALLLISTPLAKRLLKNHRCAFWVTKMRLKADRRLLGRIKSRLPDHDDCMLDPTQEVSHQRRDDSVSKTRSTLLNTLAVVY